MNILQSIASLAGDLTESLSTGDRYQRLLTALRSVIPYDAAALLRYTDDSLQPLAAEGLHPRALTTNYSRNDHPRLDIICGSREPVVFPANSNLPDPFDTLLIADPEGRHRIHGCLGCPLIVEQRLVGILTADTLAPNGFRDLDPDYLKAVSAVAAAQMRMVDLLETVERKAERQELIADDLMRDVAQFRGWEILGESGAIRRLRSEIELVGRSDFTILILGETGVGKELVARAIHRHSARSSRPMLYLNCAALPENLAESELFGHSRGAFTGAERDRAGKFELADEGTLFLDEIGELPLSIQAKLLRVIQEGELQRIGSEKMHHINVRLITATNRDLESEVHNGRFRADLYHRLNVYPITVPPLRQRKEDIPLLAQTFLERSAKRIGSCQPVLTREALTLLSRYDWPGNVRELENVVSRALLKAIRDQAGAGELMVTGHHLAGDLGAAIYQHTTASVPPPPKPAENPGLSLREQVRLFQRNLIQNALEHHQGSWAAAARELGMNRSNLHNLATRLGLRKKA